MTNEEKLLEKKVVKFVYHIIHALEAYEYFCLAKNYTKRLLFFVKYSGIGNLVNRQTAVVDLFRQSNDSIIKVHGKTAPDSSISKGLVQKQGGEIWLKSNVGKASILYSTLPFELKVKENQ